MIMYDIALAVLCFVACWLKSQQEKQSHKQTFIPIGFFALGLIWTVLAVTCIILRANE